jgi:hypothetical protein
MDPFFLFEDAPSPYAFFGIKPTLLDAPSRDEREPPAWLAHSFLARTPFEQTERHVVPLVGFSWGFDIDENSRITPRRVPWSRAGPIPSRSGPFTTVWTPARSRRPGP